MTVNQLTFIISTNGRNYPFVLPFVFFAAKHNPHCVFDIYVYDDCNIQDISSGISFVQSCFDCKINIKDHISASIIPQLYRFLVEPIDHTTYAYCCDVDIMICEDILPFHIKRLENDKYCYDNEIRQYSDPSKMSGLHFCSQDWYTHTKNVRQNLLAKTIKSNTGNTNCERILKNIAIQSHIALHPLVNSVDAFSKNRPIHGQHISLSRKPFNQKCSMENCLDKQYEHTFLTTVFSEQFKSLIELCPTKTRQIINTYLSYVGVKEKL